MDAAEVFADLESPDGYPAHMIEQGYTEAEEPGELTVDEVANFTDFTAPMLRDMHERQLTFEQWRADREQEADEIVARAAAGRRLRHSPPARGFTKAHSNPAIPTPTSV